jgi:chromosome segregation ATPase
MEKILSFVAEYSPIFSLIVTVLIGYWVSKLEPFKVRDKQHEKNIDKLDARIGNLSDFVQEQLRERQDKCSECRKEIDGLTRMDSNEIAQVKGRLDVIDEKLGGITQAFYDTQAIVTSKKELLMNIANLRLEVESLKKDNENLAHRVSLVEIDP